MSILVCPECGYETHILHEGYCESCLRDRQRALDLHNAQFDHWEQLSESERCSEIRRDCA